MKDWLMKALKRFIKAFVVDFLWKVLKALLKAAKVFLEELNKIIEDIIRK